ncbi:cryptochrome/photolyase family protein [Stagnihabitans tardus]|uniref:Cryptochrome/photolyase family protein n=1 Tax=Stagnihabitans tardus TaxID=2699202 RepID=A0AAE5BTW8_9RHOB|nr:cryptochrome/photolyase family protein [Stagnihabitans tardus]NBZ86647.1 cryptochrome/photolyase family protein [Stagnihabitans tardus]
MEKARLIVVFGDQLSDDLASLRGAVPGRDVVMMAEVVSEATPVPHHPQKIALVFAAMRKFAARLERRGFRVLYTRLDDPANAGSLPAEVLRRMAETGLDPLAVLPGDWRLRAAMAALPTEWLEDDRFLCGSADFAAWASDRKSLRMEWFYREMRRKTGLLMEAGKPAGGAWNYDHDNRNAAKRDLLRPAPLRFPPDEVVEEVLDLVAARFGSHFGKLGPFAWPTDRDQALEAMAHFMAHSLPRFGFEQDAMLAGEPFLSHSLLSPCLNLGLLSPLEVCRAAEAEFQAGRAPIASVEGFIRQIIGWREYVRGIWALKGPDYLASNALGHDAPLPPVYWGGPTKMACMKDAVGQTRDLAYAHHIQRLMVTGNFALLAGVDPEAVHRWYLAVYIDAFEWVEAPNTLGMSQFADGGLLGSKPYVASGAYIDRMSDYCGGCHYKVKEKVGVTACPFNLLYWEFLDRHRDRFQGNPRMAQMYRTWDKMDEAHCGRVLIEGRALRARIAAGEVV